MTTDVRGALLTGFDAPVELATFQLDDPAEHEVLVRTVACGVCHSDLHFHHGAMGGALPTVMGHEPAGIVEAVGPGVVSVKPGDHVIACDSLYCGSCRQCLLGRLHLCTNKAATRRPRGAAARASLDGQKVLQFGDLGGFAEAMLVHEHALVRIDDDIPLDLAALMGCAMVTGLGAALNTAQVRPGSRVAVFGCGGVGNAIIQGARIAGASQIIAIDLSADKTEHARRLGATDTIVSVDDVVRAIRDLSGGGVDYAFDAVGHPTLTAQCLYAVVPRGMAVMVGAPPRDQPVQIIGGHLAQEKILTGSFMGSNRFPIDIPYYLDLYRKGRLDLDGMIGARRPLDELDGCLAALDRGEALSRTVITFDGVAP